MTRLTAVVVAIGIAAAADGIIGRAAGALATVGVLNGTALAPSSVPRIGEVAPPTPTVAANVAPLAEVEPAGSPLEARSRGEPGRPLDLTSLKRELRATSAIGFLTKLKLRHDVRQLVEDFQRYHQGDDTIALERLGARFDRLLRNVVQLLQPDDPALAEMIAGARGALWDLLADPDADQRPTVRL